MAAHVGGSHPVVVKHRAASAAAGVELLQGLASELGQLGVKDKVWSHDDHHPKQEKNSRKRKHVKTTLVPGFVHIMPWSLVN